MLQYSVQRSSQEVLKESKFKKAEFYISEFLCSTHY